MSQRHGVVTAFVKKTDVKQGRVIVEYRSIDDKLESAWAPIASPMSGKGRGALFMPEKGDEVLVAFQDGKMDSPYVVGFLWNGEHLSPETEADNRVIVTPGGNQLRFEDKTGDRRVVLKSSGGRSVMLDDKLPGKVEIVSGAHTVTLDDTPGTASISIKAGSAGLVSISLGTLPPTVSVTTGTSTISIGPTGVTVTAAGMLTINAGLVSVNAALTTFSGAVTCSALVSNAVASPLYSPGIGNLI